MQIRHSTESDQDAIRSVHISAFGQNEGQEIAELINALLDDETAAPWLSLVAETEGRVVGHILFTGVTLPANPAISARILAPLAVSSDRQGKGIGGALVRSGLSQLQESGVDLVFVLGHSAYYPKFGFQPAGILGFEAPHPIAAEHANSWMVQELKTGIIGRITGQVQCSAVLNQPQYWRE